ncbi:hypothetical protein P8452_49975 [Trifolium repens]|nr:hypothetical protein P8452_49975 [Trifolium repens]
MVLLSNFTSSSSSPYSHFFNLSSFSKLTSPSSYSLIFHSHHIVHHQTKHISKATTNEAGEPLYVLLCCWLAAVGAGLLKTEEILEGVARLRISNDIEFEEETFIAMMDEAREVWFSHL